MAQPCLRYRNRRLASSKETLLLTKECEFECVFLLPLDSRSFCNSYVATVCEEQNRLYNVFTTFVVYFCVSHYLNILVVSAV